MTCLFLADEVGLYAAPRLPSLLRFAPASYSPIIALAGAGRKGLGDWRRLSWLEGSPRCCCLLEEILETRQHLPIFLRGGASLAYTSPRLPRLPRGLTVPALLYLPAALVCRLGTACPLNWISRSSRCDLSQKIHERPCRVSGYFSQCCHELSAYTMPSINRDSFLRCP